MLAQEGEIESLPVEGNDKGSNFYEATEAVERLRPRPLENPPVKGDANYRDPIMTYGESSSLDVKVEDI